MSSRLGFNFLTATKERTDLQPNARTTIYEMREPLLVAPRRLQTGQVDSGQLLTLKLLEQLGHRAGSNGGGFRTGEAGYDSGLIDALDSMGYETEGLEGMDSGAIKSNIRNNRIKRKQTHAQNILNKSAFLQGKGGGSVGDIPAPELQTAVQEKALQRAANDLIDKERFNQWRKLVLVRKQSVAAAGTVTINITPPRKYWATFLVVESSVAAGADFSSLQIMGETMFSGDTNMPVGDHDPQSVVNQSLDMELDTVPITGTLVNADGTNANIMAAYINGWLERISTSRR